MSAEYLLECPSGVLWHIYFDDNSRIVYSKKQNDKWSNPILLDKFIVKKFSTTVDIDEKVHIVAYTATKQLIYYQWNGIQWLYSIISTIRSRFQDIVFLKTLSEPEHIHILYHVENTLYKSTEIVYHYYGNGFNWQGGKILSFPSEDNVDIVYAHWYKVDIMHLYYSYRKGNNTFVYRSTFDAKEYIWGNPTQVLKTDLYLENIQVCIDDDKKIHIIGINIQDNTHTLYYIEDKNERIILSAQPEPFVAPIIKHLNGDIYIAWAINNKIFSIISTDGGKKFNKLKDIMAKDIFPLHHVTIKDDYYSQYEKGFGKIYPHFYTHENLVLDDINPKSSPRHHSMPDKLQEMTKEVKNLKSQINGFITQFDDLYSLLNKLNENTTQYEKKLYQLQLIVKKQANDIERLHQLITKKRCQTTMPQTISYRDECQNKGEKEKGEEVLNVGSTTIIIKNEEEEEDSKKP